MQETNNNTATGLSPYIPLSKAKRLNVYTPASMASETAIALHNLNLAIGDVDEYLRDALQYDSIAEMHQYLAAEQVDGVALAIYQIQQGKAAIIGDQTGLGKGRQGAAIIRYGVLNDINTIFLTKKATLFTDMYRDLRNIGSDDIVPFIYNNSKDAVIQKAIKYKDAEGLTRTRSISYAEYKDNDKYNPFKDAKAVNEILAEQIEKDPYTLTEGHDFLMLTYSQISSPDNGTPKIKFLESFSDGAVLVMDESHLAGGAQSNTGIFMQNIVVRTQGVCFLSATFAKRPDNMAIYALKTSFQDSGIAAHSFIDLFKSGGVPMQEIAASELVKAGQMIRRQRSFDGVEVVWDFMDDPQTKKEQTEKVNAVLDIIQSIGNFQRNYIKPMLKELNAALGVDARLLAGTADMGVRNSDYFNKAHSVIRQMMFALKAEKVAEKTLELLRSNQKVVIAFESTMGSFISDLGYSNGDVVEDTDFTRVLKKGLDGVMRYTKYATSSTGAKLETHSQYTRSQLGPFASQEYDRILDLIESVSTGLHISPIDTLTHLIERETRPSNLGGLPSDYFRVRECTGRKAQLKVEGGKTVYRTFKSDKVKFFQQFNNGDADVLLINRSSSTGVSAHASKSFEDQRRRVMIKYQAQLDINEEVQMNGRINRTRQVERLEKDIGYGLNNMPMYIYMSSSIPSERRDFMILQAKLKSLDANTTGNQTNSKSQLNVADFFNRFGGEVIYDYLEGNFDLREQLNDPCYTRTISEETGEEIRGDYVGDSNVPKRVTNRIQLLPAKEQNDFYETIFELYNEHIRKVKEDGLYDLEIDFLDLQADKQKQWLYVQGTGANNIFGQDATLGMNKVKKVKKAMTLSRINKIIEKNLDGKTPEEFRATIKSKYDEYYEGIAAIRSKGRLKAIEELKLDIQDLEADAIASNKSLPSYTMELNELLADLEEVKDEKTKLKLEKAIKKQEKLVEQKARHHARILDRTERKQKHIASKQEEIKSIERDVQQQYNIFVGHLDFFQIGRTFKYNYQQGLATQELDAIVLNFKINYKSANPFAPSNIIIHIAFGSAIVERKFTLTDSSLFKIEKMNEELSKSDEESIKKRWNKKSNALATFQTRFITDGNIFLAYSRSLGKIIRYTDKNGNMKTGVNIHEVDTLLNPDASDVALGLLKGGKYVPYIIPSYQFGSKYSAIESLPIKGEFVVEADSIVVMKVEEDKYKIIMRPHGNKKLITNEKLLQYAEQTIEEAEQGKTGQFSTYTGSWMAATFSATVLRQALNIINSQKAIKINGKSPVELDPNKVLFEVKVPKNIDPMANIKWMIDAMKIELATV